MIKTFLRVFLWSVGVFEVLGLMCVGGFTLDYLFHNTAANIVYFVLCLSACVAAYAALLAHAEGDC